MADDTVEPVGESRPIEPVHGGAARAGPIPRRPEGVIGEVTSVRRKNVHRDGQHILDETVGGEEFTEVVVRVLSGPYADLEDKRVVIFLAEE